MAMDGGIAGLEQSQHHPLAGRSQFNPPSLYSQTQASEFLASVQGDDGDQAASLIQSIKACVIPGKEDEVSRLLRELRVIVATAATTSAATSLQTSRTSFSDDDPVAIGQLKSILQEALQKPATATLQRPSYASVPTVCGPSKPNIQN
jgi:hypothetical protein